MEKLKKIWPFLVSLGGASVMVLAFFIPSVQDQWDRYQSRKVIEQYEKLGQDFFDEGRYAMAEQAFAKAFELSEEKRLDIEMKRLEARISRVNENPLWGSKTPDTVKEIDFQYLLHFKKDKAKQKARVLDSYGVFLASNKRVREAEAAYKEALQLNDKDELAHINLGNLYRQQLKMQAAEQEYLTAIALEPENVVTHYNLGVLYVELGKFDLAEKELRAAVKLDSLDADMKAELNAIVRLKNPTENPK
ncbi:MAG: tetratricopeptide repeat protein [Bacteroidetes bacterium]|nr:tetratricopeptide repeat protein [Bacteroidota bacterium]